MRELELTLKAAGDPTRTRILKLLEGGGLCVCQVQSVLGLAASTVSKHLSILKLAGLVEDRRDGRWIQYALSELDRHPFVRPLLAMLAPLDREATVIADRKRLREVKAIPLVQLCGIGPTQRRESAPFHRHRVRNGRSSPRGKARGGRALSS